jgi:hypothetical protein
MIKVGSSTRWRWSTDAGGEDAGEPQSLKLWLGRHLHMQTWLDFISSPLVHSISYHTPPTHSLTHTLN